MEDPLEIAAATNAGSRRHVRSAGMEKDLRERSAGGGESRTTAGEEWSCDGVAGGRRLHLPPPPGATVALSGGAAIESYKSFFFPPRQTLQAAPNLHQVL